MSRAQGACEGHRAQGLSLLSPLLALPCSLLDLEPFWFGASASSAWGYSQHSARTAPRGAQGNKPCLGPDLESPCQASTTDVWLLSPPGPIVAFQVRGSNSGPQSCRVRALTQATPLTPREGRLPAGLHPTGPLPMLLHSPHGQQQPGPALHTQLQTLPLAPG